MSALPSATIAVPPAAEAQAARASDVVAWPADLDHAPLAGPRPAEPRLRRLFDPVSGWFRRFERRANVWLCKAIYPRVPGISLPYTWQLDHHLTVSEADIALPELSPALAGTKILLVTDLHAGPFLSPVALARVFDRLRSLQPDLIVLGGDLTTGRVCEFDSIAAVLTRLAAAYPVHAVLGNHDHYSGDPAGLIERIKATGVQVLHNESVTLQQNGAALRLAGIDDLYCGEPDLDAALKTRGVSTAADELAVNAEPAATGSPPPPLTILLSHNPDIFFEAQRRGVALVLSGHTHGGQIRLPGLPVLVRMSRYRLDEGHYTAGAAHLVVSRGLGATGLPLRVFCSPEAVLLRLQVGRPAVSPADRLQSTSPRGGGRRAR